MGERGLLLVERGALRVLFLREFRQARFELGALRLDLLNREAHVGLSWLIAKDKDFIGKRSFVRPALRAADRKQLVGFHPEDGNVLLPEGAGLVAKVSPPPMDVQGHVTTSHWSEALGRSFGLALVKAGRSRHGETLFAPLESGVVPVKLVDPVHYDKKGERRDG